MIEWMDSTQGRKGAGAQGRIWCGLIAASLCLLAGCVTPPSSAEYTPTVKPTLAAEPPSDFAFQFEWGACVFWKVDTFDNTLSRADVSGSVPLTFSQSDVTTIYQKMIEIGLSNYPENYAFDLPDSTMRTIVTPAMHYTFRVRLNGDIKRVFWFDQIVEPTMPEADRLRDLINLIDQIIATYPAYQQLPTPSFGCL